MNKKETETEQQRRQKKARTKHDWKVEQKATPSKVSPERSEVNKTRALSLKDKTFRDATSRDLGKRYTSMELLDWGSFQREEEEFERQGY